MKMSYLVGYGSKYPEQVHHRGASIPKNAKTGCKGFQWLESTEANPNVAVGALVGGPFLNDTYIDVRNNSMQGEPTTYNSALIVGLLSGLVTTSSVAESFSWVLSCSHTRFFLTTSEIFYNEWEVMLLLFVVEHWIYIACGSVSIQAVYHSEIIDLRLLIHYFEDQCCSIWTTDTYARPLEIVEMQFFDLVTTWTTVLMKDFHLLTSPYEHKESEYKIHEYD